MSTIVKEYISPEGESCANKGKRTIMRNIKVGGIHCRVVQTTNSWQDSPTQKWDICLKDNCSYVYFNGKSEVRLFLIEIISDLADFFDDDQWLWNIDYILNILRKLNDLNLLLICSPSFGGCKQIWDKEKLNIIFCDINQFQEINSLLKI